MMLSSERELGGRGHEQGRAEKCEHCLSHCYSPWYALFVRLRQSRLAAGVVAEITMASEDYYGRRHHEAASKFLGQNHFRLNIQQPFCAAP
jgi:hypothetical protein